MAKPRKVQPSAVEGTIPREKWREAIADYSEGESRRGASDFGLQMRSDAWGEVWDVCVELGMDAHEDGTGVGLVTRFIRRLANPAHIPVQPPVPGEDE